MSRNNRQHPMSLYLVKERNRPHTRLKDSAVFNKYVVDHCPNLTSLGMMFRSNECEEESNILSQLEKLHSLHISVYVGSDELQSTDHLGMARLESIIAAVPNLKNLKLSVVQHPGGYDWESCLSLHSSSVQNIDVTGMGKCFFFRR